MIVNHFCPVCGEYVYESDKDSGYAINGNRQFKTKYMFHHDCMKTPLKILSEHKTNNNTILQILH